MVAWPSLFKIEPWRFIFSQDMPDTLELVFLSITKLLDDIRSTSIKLNWKICSNLHHSVCSVQICKIRSILFQIMRYCLITFWNPHCRFGSYVYLFMQEQEYIKATKTEQDAARGCLLIWLLCAIILVHWLQLNEFLILNPSQIVHKADVGGWELSGK